jgi:hypothetical protein
MVGSSFILNGKKFPEIVANRSELKERFQGKIY